ncbi:HdeA/HdeB family chaperone [Sphingomonas fuzhouensis]|uniref:HdeA/HdeB family chaperone n=1 Tax=Sphingomonas fuzhouensis TaxID=3106033 RepID=UPI002AFE95B0|nr:HdeA/HdeB family chaperone [Sphingomonas sp. SGZ-02]
MKMLKAFGVVAAFSIAAVSSGAFAQSVYEQAHVPGKNGVRVIEVLKSGKKMETVTCHDFGLLDESFRPQAIVYAANYGPKGKPHPTYTIDGVEKIVPVVVDQCKARPGDHFVTAVKRAIAKQP